MPKTWMQECGRIAVVISYVAFAGCAHHKLLPTSEQVEIDPVALVDPDLKALLAANVVHFDYDATNLDKHSRDRLRRIAGYLRDHAGVGIRVSGNCDERGTEEYNLMLGQRRADVAKQYLTNLGIDEGRISTVSYGKDKPAVEDHDSLAWAENRRDEFDEAAPKPNVVATRDVSAER